MRETERHGSRIIQVQPRTRETDLARVVHLMIEPQSYPPNQSALSNARLQIRGDNGITDVPVGISEAWNALSACSFFSLAVSSFFSCPTDPPAELIAGVKQNISLFRTCKVRTRVGLEQREGGEWERGRSTARVYRNRDFGRGRCPLLDLESVSWNGGRFSESSAPSHQTLLLAKQMLSTVLGFSAFGFAARVGQLAIQKRPLFSSELPLPARSFHTWNELT